VRCVRAAAPRPSPFLDLCHRACELRRGLPAEFVVAKRGTERVTARVGGVDLDFAGDMTGPAAHHDDAVGEVNRLEDAVGDKDRRIILIIAGKALLNGKPDREVARERERGQALARLMSELP